VPDQQDPHAIASRNRIDAPTTQMAGVGFFFGFFASLFFLCWPFAMIALLVKLSLHSNTN
jgi:hypothetical protein